MSPRASSCRESSGGGLNAERRDSKGYVQAAEAGRERRARTGFARDVPGRGRPDGAGQADQGRGQRREEDREPDPARDPGREGGAQGRSRRRRAAGHGAHHCGGKGGGKAEDGQRGEEGGRRPDERAAERRGQEGGCYEEAGRRRRSGGGARPGHGRAGGGRRAEDGAQGGEHQAGDTAARRRGEAAACRRARWSAADEVSAAGRAEGRPEARDRRKAVGQLSRSVGRAARRGAPACIFPTTADPSGARSGLRRRRLADHEDHPGGGQEVVRRPAEPRQRRPPARAPRAERATRVTAPASEVPARGRRQGRRTDLNFIALHRSAQPPHPALRRKRLRAPGTLQCPGRPRREAAFARPALDGPTCSRWRRAMLDHRRNAPSGEPKTSDPGSGVAPHCG